MRRLKAPAALLAIPAVLLSAASMAAGPFYLSLFEMGGVWAGYVGLLGLCWFVVAYEDTQR